MPGVFVAVTKAETDKYNAETISYLTKVSDSKSSDTPYLIGNSGYCENLHSFIISVFSWKGRCHIYSANDINDEYILHFANITDDEKRQLSTVGFQQSNGKGGIQFSAGAAMKASSLKNSVCITFADLYDNIDEIYDLFYED